MTGIDRYDYFAPDQIRVGNMYNTTGGMTYYFDELVLHDDGIEIGAAVPPTYPAITLGAPNGVHVLALFGLMYGFPILP